MQDKTTPAGGEAPEPKYSDVPGPSVRVPDGAYKIYTHLTNINLISMVMSGNPHAVNLWHENSEPQSEWYIEYNSVNDAYRIINQRYTFLILTVVNNSEVYADDPQIPLHLKHFWIFKSAGIKDVYFIESKLNLNVLDVEGSGMADGTRIIAWPYKGSANQKFKLVKLN
ncbi:MULTISPECIES: RICIN domain-containing protein [Pseudomonas]|uniref:RICIN domain-containing protein n=1 Tax=Pseudomonas TaxID=286 RepID=UPI000CD4D56A|nr:MULTISPECIES: RICIN domain-containing protein [Pseudomonas]